MKRFYLIITILFVGVSALWSQHANVIWNTPSRNSSESMPCGGGDIGMNIWVEDGDVMFYVSRSGTPVDVKLDVYGDEVFTGTINLIYPTIDATTRTFQVEIRLDNKDQRVRPGMFARATLNFGTAENVVVPDLAIVKQAGSGDRYVFVYKDGKVSYNKVELGRRMGTEYELKSGVPDNSQVVVAGQSRLVNGMEVEVEASSQPSSK